MATTPFNSTTAIADDTSPALTYNGDWISDGEPGDFNATVHGTRTVGASAQFIFRGTSVAVYGTIGLDAPTSVYLLDGSSHSVFSARDLNAVAYRQLFYQSPPLDDGEHTLLITNTGTGALWIDYLLYDPPQPVSSSTSSYLSPSTPPSSTSPPTTPTPQNPAINTPEPSSTSFDTGPPGQVNSNIKPSIPISAVVGAAIGALVLIVALIFGMLYYRKRARRLAGAKLLEKNSILGDPSELDKTDPGAAIVPFRSAYTPSPHISSGYGSSNVNMYPPGSAHPPSDYGHQNQSHPSTPIYHFSHHYALRPGYDVSSEHIASAGAGPGYGGMGHDSPQYGGTQYEYANLGGKSDYLHNPHSQYGGAQQSPTISPDRTTVPHRRGSTESTGSRSSLAYMSSERIAVDPSLPLPGILPGPLPTQTTPQRTGKGGYIVHNDSPTELRQHEDGGVRLDVHQPQGPSSQQQQVIDLPPVYKPNY